MIYLSFMQSWIYNGMHRQFPLDVCNQSRDRFQDYAVLALSVMVVLYSHEILKNLYLI